MSIEGELDDWTNFGRKADLGVGGFADQVMRASWVPDESLESPASPRYLPFESP